jgi:short-chain fatty acids transporter
MPPVISAGTATQPKRSRNLIHPFWMLPLIGMLGLKPRDIVGYSLLQLGVHVPVVLLLVWALNYTF